MTEEQRHILLDVGLDHKRSRAFIMLLVAGLILVLAIWFLQLKNAFHGAELSRVATDFSGFTNTIKDSVATAPSPQPALSVVGDAIQATVNQPVTP
ncbi:TPA: hypothetical protein DEP96_03995 [Candidatus Uhrbacteria bacterium]|nr:hypothetical protein [Candidatus Uhrbacteria bacterium]